MEVMSIDKLKMKIHDAKNTVDNDPDFLRGYDGIFQDVFDDSLDFLKKIEASLKRIDADLGSASNSLEKTSIAIMVARQEIKKIING